MKLPGWFWIAMGIWVIIGIPSFILGQGFRGYFSLLPDPPPFVYSEHLLDQTLGTAAWAVGCLLIYMPVFAVPALLVWRRRRSKVPHAQD